MARRTFIKVRRGILEAKHVHDLGVLFPLYLLMLDRANWQSGKVLFYRDQDVADQFEMPIRTVREWRRKLAELGYIDCSQTGNHQEITINKWSNPRENEDINPLYNYGEGDTFMEPNGLEGDNNMEPLAEGYIEGDMEGYIEGSRKHVTLPISDIRYHTPDSEGEKNKRGLAYQKLFSYFINSCKFIKPDNLYSVAYQLSWDNPIKDMLDISGWNADLTIDNLKVAMERADKRHLTVSDPKSLFKLYQSVVAENARREMANVGKEFNPAEVI